MVVGLGELCGKWGELLMLFKTRGKAVWCGASGWVGAGSRSARLARSCVSVPTEGKRGPKAELG